jgi:ATP-dependent helicase/nuclease subunit A
MANAGEEEWDAERATRMEAEWLATWIHDQVHSGQQWVVEKGMRVPLRPEHVAVLLRKFTNAHVYLEAMHRRGIPSLTDGERHFYRRQEIIDMVNVLRVLDDPTDALAIVGILRSSLGGVPDQDIMELSRLGPLDIRRSDQWQEWVSLRKPSVQILFEQLAALHVQAKRMPIPGFIDRVFSQLPIVELAAASSHGEQAVMNIWKLRDLMAAQAAIPHLSFSGWVDRLVDCLMTHPPEPEASLAEETLDAVRVLSIHKAKGLEFPVVVLPGLHQKSARLDRGAEVSVDWMSGVYGCSFPPTWNAGQVLLWEKEQIREKAEQRRVLYVGMTRARDRLILSGGLLTKPVRESFLGFLQHVADGEVGNPEHDMVQIGAATIRQTVVTSSHIPPQKIVMASPETPKSEDRQSISLALEKDRERESTCRNVFREAAFLTPSSEHSPQTIQPSRTQRGGSKLASLRIGTLVHRLLEQWDFQLDSESFREPLREWCRQALDADCEEDEKNVGTLEIAGLMETFLQSRSYRELQQATILGREVPFAIPWSNSDINGSVSQPCVMEGVMDVVYEVDGDIWVGDYKTDRLMDSNVVGYAERYRHQAQVYAIAASKSLGVKAKGCKLFFLRIGEMVTIMRDVARL